MIFKKKCKITYIAHGATILSENQKLSNGLEYPPINKNGEEQMYNILEFIKIRGVKNDRIISGSALCSIQSAEILSEELKKDFVINKELLPRNYGDWEGLTLEQVKKRYPEFENRTGVSMFLETPENGEDLDSFNKRVKEAVSNIVEENIGKRILVVTHPAIIRSAVCSALKIPTEAQYNIYIKTGSATQLSYFEDGTCLKYSNYVPIH